MTEPTSTDDAEQNAGARAGAQAAGGIAPRPGDPTDAATEAARAAAADAEMRARGFGDHKGTSIDRTHG